MWKRIRAVLSVVVLLAVVLVAGFAVWKLVAALVSLQEPIAIAVVAGSATILGSTIAVVIGRYFERKKEVEAHFRKPKQDQFDEFLKMLYSLTDEAKQMNEGELVEKLTELQRKLVLIGGPGTIRAYIDWKRQLTSGQMTARTILSLGAFMRALRSDLGVSSFGLKDGDFAHLYLRHADLFNAMADRNPDITLTELAEMEKKLGLDAEQASQGKTKRTNEPKK